MSLFLKLFNTTAEYNAYTADTANFIKPNVSCAMDDLTTVHYNPIPPKTRVVAKFNVTDTSNPTRIASNTSNFAAIEIDGVVQSSVVSAYTFSTTGEHTVKYTLTDPTSISISSQAFYGCTSLTSIDIPDSVTSIGSSAFNECSSLTSCTIGSGVTTIGDEAFFGCTSLTSIEIPSGVTSIGNYAFYYCDSLTSCTIGDGVTSIGTSAFYTCIRLTSIDIPDSVTSIGENAFYSCTSLTSCTIGSGVTSIGTSAFYNCIRLTSITVEAVNPPTLGSNAFQDNASIRYIYVPSASVNVYRTVWSTYAADIRPIS